MAQRVAGQRFRQRKLSTKQQLAILREDEVEALVDDEAQRNVPKVETGVEKGEETEHHLQAIISASQAVGGVGTKVSQLYIPTPEATQSKLPYDVLYPKVFAQPATYIRTSDTVEDCIGCAYTADNQDFAFLKALNQKKPDLKASVDDFETLMDFFEEQASVKQPFAAVSDAPVLAYDDMEKEFTELISEDARKISKDIYEHWKSRRSAKNNRSLMPTLKFETNVETDDSDPYVCFRRREVRQTRKTRGRDAQMTERLCTARRQLEMARDLVRHVADDQHLKLEQLLTEKAVFESRVKFKEVKRTLGIKEGDEDLINQKPVQRPKPKLDATMVPRGMPGMNLKAPLPRADGRPPESDLISLEEQKAKRDLEIRRFIDENLNKHQSWNQNYVDITWRPITPPLEQSSRSTFRSAIVEQMPTPPASEEGDDAEEIDEVKSHALEKSGAFVVRYETPQSPPWECSAPRQSYRRRMGRGGRMMIDRRGLRRPLEEVGESVVEQRMTRSATVKRKLDQENALIDERPNTRRRMNNSAMQELHDRYKYDRDSDEDDDLHIIDPHENSHMRFRVLMEKTSASIQARRSIDAGQAQANHNRSASGQHLLPPVQ